MAGEPLRGCELVSTDDLGGIDVGPGIAVDVWSVAIEAAPNLVARARSLLSADERERADAFRFQRLRDEFTVSRATLRVLLSRMVGALPADLRFAYGAQGKPALAGAVPSSLQFNASHSGGLLACAFAHSRPIGVDVEQHRPIAELERIAQRFFSPAECRDLMRFPETARTAAFYDCWSRKEAFIKALGGGLSIPLDSFRVSLAPRRAALLEVSDAPAEARAWTIHNFHPLTGFSGALAIRARSARVHLRRVSAMGIFVREGLL